MWEIIENLPSWAKLTGISIPLLIIILFIISSLAGPEVIETPKIINEAKHNATEEMVNATTIVAEESSKVIISEFHEAGEAMARNVDDPKTKKEIINYMDMAGFFIALSVVMIIFSALYSALNGNK